MATHLVRWWPMHWSTVWLIRYYTLGNGEADALVNTTYMVGDAKVETICDRLGNEQTPSILSKNETLLDTLGVEQ